MITPNNISVINEVVLWTIKVTNGPTNNVGVSVALSIPAGWALQPGEVLAQGTLLGNTWTVGSMIPAQQVIGVFPIQKVVDLLGQPWNFIATVSGLDTLPGNNILTDTVFLGTCPLCPPAAGAVDDPFACVCGNVATNDTACTSGTTTWVIDMDSTINIIVNSFNPLTGEYNVTPIDPNLPWSFEYSIWCDTGGGPLEISGPAVVNGSAIFADLIQSKFIKEDFLNLPIGNTTVTLGIVPTPGTQVFVYRNGSELPQVEWSILSDVITFVLPFGVSTGASGLETVTAHYWIP